MFFCLKINIHSYLTMQKGLIGVITPVYKVEEYIAECIESILAQTYTNIRLILVDDGTPDNAGKICDEYAKKDPRITVIHQQNAGATRARAHGVEEAKDCEYIAFVDSDDTIAPNYLQHLHNAMSEEVDIVLNNSVALPDKLPINRYRTQLIGDNRNLNVEPWNKLFRRELFNAHTFDIPRSIVVGEDMLMNIRLAFASKKEAVATINIPGIYYYRQNESGIMHSFNSTPEYEHRFQQCLKRSIPNNLGKEYLELTIKNRLKSFKKFWGKKCSVKGMKDTEFYQELKSDMEVCGYSLHVIERTLFTNESPVIRFFAIVARGVMKPFYKRTAKKHKT